MHVDFEFKIQSHLKDEIHWYMWSFIMIKSNRCAILPECDTLV